MAVATRKIGLDILTDVPWGTHLCQFYKSKEDLTGILVPYFKAGLESNEFCMWVTSEPLGVEDAKIALKKAVHDLDSYIAKGQIEIFDYSQWYTISGKFEADKVLQGWVEKEKQALERGFDGLRLTGNNFWLEEEDWSDFVDYEAMIDTVIGKHMMIAICSYPANKCGVSEVIDVVKNHQFALIRREDQWEVIESAGRKQAEDALRRSEENFRNSMDASPLGIRITTAEGELLYANQAILDMYSYSSIEELKAVPTKQRYTRESYAEHQERKKKRRRGQPVPSNYEISIVRKDSEVRHLAAHRRQVMWNGETQFQSLYEDITERKQAEEELRKHRDHLEELVKERTAELETVNEELQREISERWEAEQALRESEEELRTLFQSTREGIITSGPDGRILSANSAAAAMLGYDSPEELVGIPAVEVYEDPEQRTALFQELMAKGHAGNWELTLKKKDSTLVHVLLAATIHNDQEGNLLRAEGMFMDITERKQAEELFRTLASSSQTAIYIVQDGKFRYVNPQFQRCTGYSEEELLGTDSLRLVLPEDRAIVRESAVKILQGELSSTCEFRALNKNGEIRYAMEVVTLIQYQGRQAILGNYIDITERKQMQEKLLVAERLATLGELSGSISHELRNPLGVIDSSAYYLKTKLKGADVKVQQHLHRIRSSVDSATGIIESLLNLTRMKAPQAERLNLIAIASDAIIISEVPATLKVIQDFAEHEVWVNADRGQLHMAFKNIVTNAVQAMDGKGTLTVTVRKTADGEAEISFTDTGPGIAAENLDKVFQPLFSTKTKGIGFGLSIAKMIIDKHGGTIEAKFEPGEGANIIIRLPPYVNKGKGA